MIRRCLLVVLVCLYAIVSQAADYTELAERLQNQVVTVKAGGSQGSGFVVVRAVDGKNVYFVITAHHVIDGLRYTEKTGDKEFVKYRPLSVVRPLVESSKIVGYTEYHAHVLSTSPRHDTAVLKLLVSESSHLQTASFWRDDEPPAIGAAIVHCASPGGQSNIAYFTIGNIAGADRQVPGFDEDPEEYYTPLSCPALPGSSGGMIADTSGRVVGILVLGHRSGDNFTYMVPVRRMREFFESSHLGFLLDDSGKTTKAELGNVPLEASKPKSNGLSGGHSTNDDMFFRPLGYLFFSNINYRFDGFASSNHHTD